MRINVMLFAGARERVSSDAIALDVPAQTTLSRLRDLMDEEVPALRGLPGRWAVNLEFAPADYVVKAEDELAWIPPVSGG